MSEENIESAQKNQKKIGAAKDALTDIRPPKSVRRFQPLNTLKHNLWRYGKIIDR